MKKLFLLLFFVLCSVFYSFAQDRSVYKSAEEFNEKVSVDDILYTNSLEDVVELKGFLILLKNNLLNELKTQILYLEEKLARKEIERSVWLESIMDYILLSYNLELLLYACELKLEDKNFTQK